LNYKQFTWPRFTGTCSVPTPPLVCGS